MKPIYLLFICLCLSMMLQAQLSKTVELSSDRLNTILTRDELATISNLTITGGGGEFDFETINAMPLLSVLDLSGLLIFQGMGNQCSYFYFGSHLLQGNNHIKSVILPIVTTSIGIDALKNCTALSSVTIPSSVGTIFYGAFEGCKSLKSIYAYPSYPPQLLDAKTFADVDKNTCMLYIPFGAKKRYTAAEQWKDFKNMVEMPVFKVSGKLKHFLAQEGSKDSIIVSSYADWTVQTDQAWLRLIQTSGKGNSLLFFTADANTSSSKRTAIVTVSFSEAITQTLTIYQPGIPKILNVTAGELCKLYPEGKIDSTITNLVVKGTMDARDFEAINYQMPMLEVLDLSDVDIAAYDDKEFGNYYPENELPLYAFEGSPWLSDNLKFVILPLSLTSRGGSFGWCNNLVSVIIPSHVTSIGGYSDCYNLTSINIPSSVTSIEGWTFSHCSSLTSLNIPSSVSSIGDDAFFCCYSLTSINLPSSVTSVGNRTFGFCRSLTTITIPSSFTSIGDDTFAFCSSLTSINIPPSVASIGDGAFSDCSSLTSLIIPSSVKSIGDYALYNCSGLTSINCNSKDPINLNYRDSVFAHVDKTSCILYVPTGSKDLYAEAYQWRDFKNIVEIPTGVDDLEQNNTKFKCYPNPFTSEISIEIHNPKHIKLTVDIYNMADQRVKNLAIGNTSEQVNLSWDGTNEQGQQLPMGVYICKMNRQTMQIVKGR